LIDPTDSPLLFQMPLSTNDSGMQEPWHGDAQIDGASCKESSSPHRPQSIGQYLDDIGERRSLHQFIVDGLRDL
jgi:hypothetical protein